VDQASDWPPAASHHLTVERRIAVSLPVCPHGGNSESGLRIKGE